MPPVKPIPSLFLLSLKSYGVYCLSSLIRMVDSGLEDNCEEDRISKSEKRVSSIKEAKLYVQKYTTAFTLDELLKFGVQEILGSRWNNTINDIVELIWTKDINLYGEEQWKILRDFMVIHGDERIKKLDFNKGNKISHCIDHYQMQDILSQTLFQNPSWSKNLVLLNLKYFSNMDIVEAIGRHCPNLEHLDITRLNFVRFQDTEGSYACLSYLYGGVENMNTGCPKLRTIILPRAIIEHHSRIADHIVKMIIFMPDLRIVRNVDTRIVAIKYMEAVGQLCTMKLTEFEDWCEESYNSPAFHRLDDSLGQFFPFIKRYASFVSPEIYISHGLLMNMMLNQFSNLSVIELYFCDQNMLSTIEFMNPFPSVKVFKVFQNMCIIDNKDIQIINNIFPNLEILRLDITRYRNDGDNDLVMENLFPELKSLEVLVLDGMLDPSLLHTFLEKCPSIRNLEMFCIHYTLLKEGSAIDDELVSHLKPKIANLEKIIIAYHPHFLITESLGLTYEAVLCFLSACPKIRCLGDLSHWFIRDEERKIIRNLIKERNWYVELVHISDTL